MNYKKILKSLAFGLVMALVMGGAAYAVTTITGTLKLTGTREIDYNIGGSKIYDDKHLHIATDDVLYLDAGEITVISKDLKVLEDLDVTGDLVVDGTTTGTFIGSFSGSTTATSTTATTFTFGQGKDADVQDMLLNLGSIDSATLTWTGTTVPTSTLTFSDNFEVDGTTTLNGNVLLGDSAADTVLIAGDTTFTSTGAHAITISGATTSAPIYTNITQTTAGTLGWLTYTSDVVTGDLTGLRPIVTSNAGSGGGAATGVNVRGAYSQAVCGASKHAGLLQGSLSTASIAAGSCTVYNVHVLGAHFSTGAGATIGNDLYVGYFKAQTRGDESITGTDVLLGLENQAVGGNGKEMDSALRIFDTNISGGIKGFGFGIDMTDATFATADIRLSTGVTISSGAGVPTANCTEGSLYLRTDGGDNVANLYVCDAVAADWDVIDFTN